MTDWEKKVERMENNPRRKAKESRTREYYERQFPEIRKQREQQERFQRSVRPASFYDDLTQQLANQYWGSVGARVRGQSVIVPGTGVAELSWITGNSFWNTTKAEQKNIR